MGRNGVAISDGEVIQAYALGRGVVPHVGRSWSLYEDESNQNGEDCGEP